MKKRLISLTVALMLVLTIVASCIGNIVSFAATIAENSYPYLNNRVNVKLNYETSGTDMGDITTYRITNDNFAISSDRLAVTLNHLGASSLQKLPYFRYKTLDRAENMQAMSIHIDNSENGSIVLGFTPHLDSTFDVVATAKYYLVSDSGIYKELSYSKEGNVSISAGYIGTVVVPFSNFTGIDVKDITGFRITYKNVPISPEKHIYFDNFSYIGDAYTSGEVAPEKFPYTLEDKWDEYDYTDASPFTPVGDTLPGSLYVKDGKLSVGLDNANASSGFSAALSQTYSSSYDAAYLVVDAAKASATNPVSLKLTWNADGNIITLKNGGEYYVRLEDGRVYKYTATKEGVVTLPSDIGSLKAEIAVPYESMVVAGTTTAVGKPNISGITVTFEGVTAEGTNELKFSDIGYVKSFANGFIIPPNMTGTVVPESQVEVDMNREIKPIISGSEPLQSLTGCEDGVDQRDVVYTGGKLGIPMSGNPSFKWTLNSANAYQGVSFDVDVIDAKKPINLSMEFGANSKTGVIAEGKAYYLKSDHDGLYYKYYQTEEGAKNGTIFIPTNFKGKVIVPFDSLQENTTKEKFETASTTTLKITLSDLNGTDKRKYIRFSNVILHRTDEWIGDNAYKIEVGVSHPFTFNNADYDMSMAQPTDDAYKGYIYKDYTEFYNFSFTTDGAYSGTAQKMVATQDFVGRKIISGFGPGGSWTYYGYNALRIWVDTTSASPDARYQFYMAGTGVDGNPIEVAWLKEDSKIFLYNEKLNKAKLATIIGNEVVLDNYKGWVILPMTQFHSGNEVNSFERISWTYGWGGGIYIGGLKTGDTVIIDEAQAIVFEAPGEIPYFVPDIGYIDLDEITYNRYMPLYNGGYIVQGGSAATGVNTVDIVVIAAFVGTTSLGVGIFAGKRRKKSRS